MTDETIDEKRAKLERLARDRRAVTSHCAQDKYLLRAGEQTLFVNASIQGHEEFPHMPWVVDIELPAKHAEIHEL